MVYKINAKCALQANAIDGPNSNAEPIHCERPARVTHSVWWKCIAVDVFRSFVPLAVRLPRAAFTLRALEPAQVRRYQHNRICKIPISSLRFCHLLFESMILCIQAAIRHHFHFLRSSSSLRTFSRFENSFEIYFVLCNFRYRHPHHRLFLTLSLLLVSPSLPRRRLDCHEHFLFDYENHDLALFLLFNSIVSVSFLNNFSPNLQPKLTHAITDCAFRFSVAFRNSGTNSHGVMSFASGSIRRETKSSKSERHCSRNRKCKSSRNESAHYD